MAKYKIALIGAQGSGKTTKCYELAAELKKKGKDVYVLSEVARSCPLPLNEDATKESQFWIFGKQMTREQSARAEILISDRTLLDPFVYGYRKYPKTFESLKSFVKEYMKTYILVVYLPPNDEYLKDDGNSSTNKEFRDEIDKITLGFMKEMDIKITNIKDVIPVLEEMGVVMDREYKCL